MGLMERGGRHCAGSGLDGAVKRGVAGGQVRLQRRAFGGGLASMGK